MLTGAHLYFNSLLALQAECSRKDKIFLNCLIKATELSETMRSFNIHNEIILSYESLKFENIHFDFWPRIIQLFCYFVCIRSFFGLFRAKDMVFQY